MHSPSLELHPIHTMQGEVVLPGSKSISNRVLLLSALASGASRLHGLLDADDTRVMRNALKALGVSLHEEQEQGRTVVTIEGVDGAFPNKKADLFLGNAGTAVRPLTAALAILGGDYLIHGVARMHERPIADLVDGLLGVGAQISYEKNAGYPPIRIGNANLQCDEAVKVRGDVSSQFLTALLMALPLAKHPRPIQIEVIGELISKPYIEITLALMKQFGVVVENHDWQRFTIPAWANSEGCPYYGVGDFWVEGDASSASYFLAAGALGGGPIKLNGIGRNSIQGDIAFAGALSMMGVNVSQAEHFVEVRGVDHPQNELQAIELDCTPIPDAAMTLAVLGLFTKQPMKLRGIASWKVKETDRIHAIVTELRKFGARVHFGDDFIEVQEPLEWMIPDGGVDTYDDHRMAMCFSLAAFGPVPFKINDPACVSKTFPTYFEQFLSLVRS